MAPRDPIVEHRNAKVFNFSNDLLIILFFQNILCFYVLKIVNYYFTSPPSLAHVLDLFVQLLGSFLSQILTSPIGWKYLRV